MGPNSSRQPVAMLNCKQTPSFRGSQARATPSESQPSHHRPALPAKTAPTEGCELDAPLKPSHLQTPHRFSSSHCHQLRDALCPPGTAPGTLHSAKLPRGALAGPVPRALGLRNHWFWKRNRISGNSSQDDAVMEAAPQARLMLSLNVLSWHHQRGLCPLPGAPVGSGLRLSQDPVKTSSAQAGKCLSILCAPTVAQTRGKRPDAAHPLADPQHGPASTCFDTGWPPPHEGDKASRDPLGQTTPALTQGALHLQCPAPSYENPRKSQQHFSGGAFDGIDQEDRVHRSLGAS